MRHYHSRLIDGLVGEHQGHVAIDTDRTLLHTADIGGEVLRNEIDALHQLTADERLGIVEVVGIIGHMDIGRSIAFPDKLSRELGVAIVYYRHRHLAHGLVVVDPRV